MPPDQEFCVAGGFVHNLRGDVFLFAVPLCIGCKMLVKPLVEEMVIAKLDKQRGWEHKKISSHGGLTQTITEAWSGNARGIVELTSRPNRHAIGSERPGGGTV